MKKTLLILCCALYSLATMAQWSNDPTKDYLFWPEGKEIYGKDMAISPDGTTWSVLYHPESGGMIISVQAIDSTGVKLFGEKGLVVSDKKNRSWTAVNDYLFVDRDGNAIVVAIDARNAPEDMDVLSAYAYKISPKGEFLWGEEGIPLDNGLTHELIATMRIIQLEDDSYVFAWSRVVGTIESNLLAIDMQRLDKDGKLQWNADDVRLVDNTISYANAWLVNAGNNQCILVYAKGSNQDIYARKLDFDGTPVWAEDTRIYRGGWGGIPIHTLIDAQPANGGVVVSWNDDRYFEQEETAYMSYVKSNGEHGFTAGEGGQKLGYAEMGKCLSVKCKYDAKTNSFIAFWRESSSGQSWYHMVAQRVSMSGELLWGDNGLEIEPLRQVTMSYNSVQNGREGEIALFYMVNENNIVANKAVIFDIATGESIWDEGVYSFADVPTEKSGLESTVMANDNFFVTLWKDSGITPEGRVHDDYYCMQRINYDRTVGYNDTEGVTKTQAKETTFGVLSTIVNGETVFTVEGSGEKAMLAIYDLQGRLVDTVFDGTLPLGKQYIEWNGSSLAGGVYIATLATGGKTSTIKLLIQ